MRYRCCIAFDIHKHPEPEDVPFMESELVGFVRLLACQMLTEEDLELVSPIQVKTSQTKAKAYMTVDGPPGRSPTFIET